MPPPPLGRPDAAGDALPRVTRRSSHAGALWEIAAAMGANLGIDDVGCAHLIRTSGPTLVQSALASQRLGTMDTTSGVQVVAY